MGKRELAEETEKRATSEAGGWKSSKVPGRRRINHPSGDLEKSTCLGEARLKV